jgi:hypothetical protein
MGPIDAESRVIPTYSTGTVRVVRGEHMVEDACLSREGKKTVGQSRSHVHRREGVGPEVDGKPLAIRDGFLPKIDHHIIDLTLNTRNELGSRARRDLVVHPSQGVERFIMRQIALNDRRFQTAGRKLFHAESAREEASFIMPGLEFDFPATVERSRVEKHR